MLDSPSTRISAESYAQADKLPVRLVLENIRSGLNVGAFFRSADAFRIEGLDLCGYTAHPPQKDILKSALGASEHVPWRTHEDATHAILQLKNEGFLVASIEQTAGSISLETWHPQPHEKWAFVFGNEVRGVESSTTEQCHLALEIPQFGVKQSLNVSVCGGIVLWDAAVKMGFGPMKMRG